MLGELVERIDEALATARASEAAVMTVGAAALDAAEQAKRAAELAERASAAMAAGPATAGLRPAARRHASAVRARRGRDGGLHRPRGSLAERLQRLQRLPLSA